MPYIDTIPDAATKGRKLHWQNRVPTIEVTHPNNPNEWTTLVMKHDRVVAENSRGVRVPLTYEESWEYIKLLSSWGFKVRGYARNLPKEDRV